MTWRLVLTDSETLSGVAPVCPLQGLLGGPHDTDGRASYDVVGVYDCCPGPQIECWSDTRARRVLADLNEAAAEVCE